MSANGDTGVGKTSWTVAYTLCVVLSLCSVCLCLCVQEEGVGDDKVWLQTPRGGGPVLTWHLLSYLNLQTSQEWIPKKKDVISLNLCATYNPPKKRE